MEFDYEEDDMLLLYNYQYKNFLYSLYNEPLLKKTLLNNFVFEFYDTMLILIFVLLNLQLSLKASYQLFN